MFSLLSRYVATSRSFSWQTITTSRFERVPGLNYNWLGTANPETKRPRRCRCSVIVLSCNFVLNWISDARPREIVAHRMDIAGSSFETRLTVALNGWIVSIGFPCYETFDSMILTVAEI